MLSDKFAAYGSAPILSGQKRKDTTSAKQRPTWLVLTGCLLVPLSIFAVTFWLRSFELHYQSETLTNIMCYILLLVPVTFGVLAYYLVKSDGDAKPMILLATMSLLAWISAFLLGGSNFHVFMRPYYDIEQLNVYPSVDPSKYAGQQLMDAGQIHFTPGAKLGLDRSVGFKDGDIYCIAPIVSGNGSQTLFDFWAVGVNCCSGHRPDFHCGEYLNPSATKGLRLMDDSKRTMFQLVVKKATAEFGLNVSHPIFLHWLADPEAEVSAYEDDGWQSFVKSTFAFFCMQLCVVVCAAAVFAKM